MSDTDRTAILASTLLFGIGVLVLLAVGVFLMGCDMPRLQDEWWRSVEVCDGEGVCKNIIVDNKDELKK